MTNDIKKPVGTTRRNALKTLELGAGAVAAAASLPMWARYAQAQSSEPIRVGFQVHRTGIGAAYGRWYDRTTQAVVKQINAAGGINGRPVEIIAEDDGTDPKRGAEVVEKFANQSKCDIAYGTLFSHVVIGSAPRAGELKLPYFVVSEGHHLASGMLNRYTLQPGITDVKSQVQAMAPFVAQNLGKKITMIFPDFAFGHDHRDYFTAALEAQGGEVLAHIAIPPSETSFTKHFPKIPRDTEVIYHVMVGPAVLTFVKELGEFFGPSRPEMFGFIDSLEAVDLASPGLEFLEVPISGRATRVMHRPTRRLLIKITGRLLASMTMVLQSAIRRMFRPIPICLAAGKLFISSRPGWRPRTIKRALMPPN